MAKVKGYMEGNVGKVGNITYYRDSATGETVTRKIVTPKNPKTNAQTVQRVIAKQVGAMYSMMQEIADHSFQGKAKGAQCAAEFRRLNMIAVRDRAAEIQNSGHSLYEYYQFQPINSIKQMPNAVILSQGSLDKVNAGIAQSTELDRFAGSFDGSENTYQAIVGKYGLRRGDQLTFCAVTKDADGDYRFKYARVILDPRNPDGSGAAMSSAFCEGGSIVNPNRRNAGSLSIHFAGDRFEFALDGNDVAAAGIIVSRKANDYWMRSNCKMVISEEVLGADLCSLMEAVDKSYTSSEIYVENEEYLNNAGEGGSQGDITPEGGETSSTSYSNTATIDGVSQNVAGGSVSVNGSLSSIVLSGISLSDSEAYLTVNNGAHVLPTARTSGSVTFSNINAQPGDVVRVYKSEGVFFFAVAVNAQGGGDEPQPGDSVTVTNVTIGVVTQAITNGTSRVTDDAVASATSMTVAGTNMGSETAPWTVSKDGGADQAATAALNTSVTLPMSGAGVYRVKYNGTLMATITALTQDE